MSRFAREPRLALAICMLLLGAAVAFPLGVIASHRFSDVPDSNTYHADIDALADAGVTTGCGNGTTYCPGDFVTREQMAAFMNRLGALAAGKTPVVNATKLDGIDSTDFLKSETVNGVFACTAHTMTPATNAGWDSTWAAAWSATSTDVSFRCNVLLPDGATVTSAEFEVYDASATERVVCGLHRFSVDAVSDVAPQEDMAAASTTNGDVPAVVVLSDDTIQYAGIDNLTFHYFAVCTPTATGITTQVVGVRIHYAVTGLPLP